MQRKKENKYLKNILKGLLVALIIVCLGGMISLHLKPNLTNNLVLISTSLVNTIFTNNENNVDLENELSNEENEVESIVVEQNTDSEVNEFDENSIENKVEDKDIEIFKENIESNSNIDNSISETVETSEIELIIKGEYMPNLDILDTVEVLATYTGKITAYGPDCYGCTTGRTASGQYVLDGNIYYNDAIFGNIRIVAADKSIPFGSIVKISGLSISVDPILAIVLDRGGAIGFAEGKHAYFDLLYKSEADATSFGRPTATFEILRYGY